MRTTLIMFAILLLVLTLLSTFGGSISFQKEPFFADEEEVVMPPVPPPVEPVQSIPSNPVTGEQPPISTSDNLAALGDLPDLAEMNGGVPEPFTQEEKHKEQFAPF